MGATITLDTVALTKTLSGEDKVEFTDLNNATANLRDRVEITRERAQPNATNAGVARPRVKFTTPRYNGTLYAPLILNLVGSLPAAASAADIDNLVDKVRDFTASAEFRSLCKDALLP